MFLISYFDAFVVGVIISSITTLISVPLAIRYLTPDDPQKEDN